MKCLLCLSLLVPGLLTSPVASASSDERPDSSPILRADLQTPLTELFCHSPDARVSQADLWVRGVIDANVTVEEVKRKDEQSAAIDELAIMAKNLARAQMASGYAFGICPDPSRAWVASVPAATALPIVDGTLSVPDTGAFCRSVNIHHVAADTGTATALVPKGGLVAIKGLPKGTLSFTCLPRQPAWQGPVLWFLAPIAGGPTQDPPARETLAKSSQPEQKLADWVNAIREAQRLAPLQHEREGGLQSAVLSLSLKPTLAHDQRQLDSTAKHLKNRYVFQGEDRVAGNDIATMAWLLWNSPQHRALLLRAEANTIAVNVKKRGGMLYAVLVVAQKGR